MTNFSSIKSNKVLLKCWIVSHLIIEDFAERFYCFKHWVLHVVVVFNLLQQCFQHQILLLQLPNLLLACFLPSLQLLNPLLHLLHCLHCVSLLFLVEFGWFSVAPDALALLAVATLVAIERALFEEFSHLLGIEVGVVGFGSGGEMVLVVLFLDEYEFWPGQS